MLSDGQSITAPPSYRKLTTITTINIVTYWGTPHRVGGGDFRGVTLWSTSPCYWPSSASEHPAKLRASLQSINAVYQYSEGSSVVMVFMLLGSDSFWLASRSCSLHSWLFLCDLYHLLLILLLQLNTSSRCYQQHYHSQSHSYFLQWY